MAFSRTWSAEEEHRSSNWKELRALLEPWITHPDILRGKLVIMRTDNATAAGYANIGTGSSPQLAELSRQMKLIEVELGAFVLCSHISGVRNSTADALSRMAPLVNLPAIESSVYVSKRFWARIKESSPTIRSSGPFSRDSEPLLERATLHERDRCSASSRSPPMLWVPPHDFVARVVEFLRDKAPQGTLALLPLHPAHPWISDLKDLHLIRKFDRGQRLFSQGYTNSAGEVCAIKEAFGLFSRHLHSRTQSK